MTTQTRPRSLAALMIAAAFVLGTLAFVTASPPPAQAWTTSVSVSGSPPGNGVTVYPTRRHHQAGAARITNLKAPGVCYPMSIGMRNGNTVSHTNIGNALANGNGTHSFGSPRAGWFYMWAQSHSRGCSGTGTNWTGTLWY